MNHIRPQRGETAASVLGRTVGKFLLLDVTVSGKRTSVCVNVESSGSAAWRRKEENKKCSLKISLPPFALTDRTLVLSYDDVNTLANNFHVIREAIPSQAVDKNGNVAIGKLPRDKTEMGLVLAGLEQRTDEILAICIALGHSLDTQLRSLRLSLGHSVRLMNGDALSEYAGSVLSSFSESQRIFAGFPMLRGFGTQNSGRSQACPSKGDARLRYYMQHNKINPLATSRPLDFISYELKPLNISDTLTWNCALDPRTDSVDLLMSLSGSPVVVEVKMAGDKFVSAAVVQVLYYASILANDKQKDRLTREFTGFTSRTSWLCVIAEQRDNTGFVSDLATALSFLRHEETRKTLSPFFNGAAVLIIEENPEPFCRTRGIPSFRVVKNGEYFVEW